MSDRMVSNDGRVVTLGMFIIDRFRRVDAQGNEIQVDRSEQLGGAGTYFSVGARTFLPPDQIGQIIHFNPSETSQSIIDKLRAYDNPRVEPAPGTSGMGSATSPSMWHFRESEHTSLIMNTYEGELRVEKFLARSPQVWPRTIVESPLLTCLTPGSSPSAQPTSYPQLMHFCTSPQRAQTIIDLLADIQAVGHPEPSGLPSGNIGHAETRGKGWNPGLIWEIYPPDAKPENLEITKRITRKCLVSSPNHNEALGLFGIVADERKGFEGVLVKQVEGVVREMVGWLYIGSADKQDVDSINRRGSQSTSAETWRLSSRAIIVRCGALGACIGQISDPASGQRSDPADVQITWVDAYWRQELHPDAADRVVDVTGGGNAFEGGLAAGLKLSRGDVIEAVLHASVAASFAIEQDGLPVLTRCKRADGIDEERWNGEQAVARLHQLRLRLRASGGAAVLPKHDGPTT